MAFTVGWVMSLKYRNNWQKKRSFGASVTTAQERGFHIPLLDVFLEEIAHRQPAIVVHPFDLIHRMRPSRQGFVDIWHG